MQRNLKTLTVVAAALAASLCVQWAFAQKTAGASSQQWSQQSSSSSAPSVGKQPNAVYGGYQSNSARATGKRPARPAAPRPPQPSYAQQQQQYEQSGDESSASYDSSSSAGQQQEADSEPASYGAKPGQPGVDFPNYAQVPKTSFTCDDKPYDGFYPDEEAQCQAYHVCWENRRESFLCGVGTLFNAANQHCDYWYNVECNKSRDHWSLNRFFGTSTPENAPSSGPVQAPRGSSPSRQVPSEASGSSSQGAFVARRPLSKQRPQQQQQTQQEFSDSSSSNSWRQSQQVQLQQQEY